MENQEELASEFLKIAVKHKLKEKLEERKARQNVHEVKKQIKTNERLMKRTIMGKPEREPLTKPNNFAEEKKRIAQMSELVVHSKQGIKKISEEFEKPPGRIYEEEEKPEAIPRAITAEEVLETPLSPGFKKEELEIPVPRFNRQGGRVENLEENPNLIMPDFGKINELVKSPSISIIQCDGPKEEIKITRNGKIEKTGLKLNEEEIKAIIKKFSDRTRKEITQPVFKATFSNLELTAIISDFSGSRFVILKK